VGLSRKVRLATVGVATAAVVLTGCAESERDSSSGDGGGEGGGTFRFAASAEPVTLDPFFASDGETFRVSRQIFEGLVGVEPGTADPAPTGLATEWESSEDGLTHTFTLREGVTFHDGSDFNAEAVCFNFDRWYNLPESSQVESLAYYYGALFGGFATGDNADNAIYDSCEASGEYEATITLTEPFSGFIAALSLPAFAMQSPTALQEYQDDGAQNPTTTEYATSRPSGTGPFQLEEWNQGTDVTLTAYDDYWGDPSTIDEAVVVPIAEPRGRADALRNDEIDGYDLVGPADISGLEEEGFQIVNRDPFNVLYLGFNQAKAPFDDLKVRQAIAYAIDKEEVVSASLPEGSEVAIEFMPPSVNGWADDVETYDYDPDRARQLLEEAGVAGDTIQFNYPTDVSRPYMPSPEDTFNVIRTQLEEVGLDIEPVADRWDPDYLNKIQGSENHGIHLLGWTGDYNDTDNFIGQFFGSEKPEWGFNDPQLFQGLREARGEPSVEDAAPLYEDLNREVMELLPGVPLAHPVPSLAFGPGVGGYEASPVQDEVWNTVTLD
jgi:peptide/nickel transport system substrate-binding protein